MYDIIQQWGYFIGKHMDFSSTYMIMLLCFAISNRIVVMHLLQK